MAIRLSSSVLCMVCVACGTASVASTGDESSTGTSTGVTGSVTGTDGSESETTSAPTCPAPGVEGTEPGQTLPNVEVRPCEGDLVGLAEMACGHVLTLVDIGAAAVPACVETTDVFATDPAYDALQARGLNIVQVFLFDQQGNLPTTMFCSEYVTEHEIDFTFLIDQVGNTNEFAPLHPFNVVLDEEARVVALWVEDIPVNRLELLDEMLAERE